MLKTKVQTNILKLKAKISPVYQKNDAPSAA